MFEFLKPKATKPGTDFKTLKDEGAIILDVRSASEYQEGHIKGSMNIPLNEVSVNANTIKNLDKKVITVCRSGARSESAKKILSDLGIETFNGGSWLQLNKILKK